MALALTRGESSKTPTILNVSVPNADTEVSQALASGTKRFTIKVRGSAQMKLAYSSGQSGLVYLTLPPGTSYEESELSLTGVTLYFQTNKTNQTVEIVQWV